MNCAEMRNRLAGLPGEFRDEDMSPPEREHLESCVPCREFAVNERSVRDRIAVAGRVAPPGDSYWATIVPRVRKRTTRRLPSDRLAEWFASTRYVVQGAGLAVIVLFLLTVDVTDPPVSGSSVTMASLSESELLALRSSVRYTGLLDHSSDPAAANGSTIVDFLAELMATDEGSGLYASVDPAAVLGAVDDASLGEIVDLLNSK